MTAMRNSAVMAVSGVKNSGKTALIAAMLPHLAAGAWGMTIFDGEKYKVVRAGNSAASAPDPATLLALVTDLPLEVSGVPALPLGTRQGRRC